MQDTHTSPDMNASRQWSPAWIAAIVVAVIVLALLSYAIATQPTASLQVGSPVPDFQLAALDGNEMSLSAQQGKVVVLNFFASWCAPCREEAADLEQTWREHQGQGVQFFGIAYKDADSKAQAFLDEFGITYPSTVEPGNRTARAYGLTGVPETFVIDQRGQLVRHFLGPVTKAQLSQEVDRALGQ
jgi:cytochrome c biogenesis protein CcmG/thiol:disulfide interchange protein DsbE